MKKKTGVFFAIVIIAGVAAAAIFSCKKEEEVNYYFESHDVSGTSSFEALDALVQTITDSSTFDEVLKLKKQLTTDISVVSVIGDCSTYYSSSSHCSHSDCYGNCSGSSCDDQYGYDCCPYSTSTVDDYSGTATTSFKTVDELRSTLNSHAFSPAEINDIIRIIGNRGNYLLVYAKSKSSYAYTWVYIEKAN